MWYDYAPRPTAAERRRKAAAAARRLAKQGRVLAPVVSTGRQLATTFWGRAWCEHLATYSDYDNRLPRGRAYARNGSIIDLQVTAGRVAALVQGTLLYEVEIKIKRLAARRWQVFKQQAAGRVLNLLDLLQGKLPVDVLTAATHRDAGLFPAAKEIAFTCSCPDWARMCKHVAAVLYGVGVRLDHDPGMFFVLRGVDAQELLTAAASAASRAPRARRMPAGKGLDADALSEIFGVELEAAESNPMRRPKSERPEKPVRSRPSATVTRAKPPTRKPAVQKIQSPSRSKGAVDARRKSKAPTGKVVVAVRRADDDVEPGSGPAVSKASRPSRRKAAVAAPRGKVTGRKKPA